MVILKEVNNMFWGLTIDGGRRYSQTVDRPFHVSMASLEINPQSPDKGPHVQVMLQQESSQFLLCTLGPGSHLQQQLDLHFSSGETVEFFLVGKGVVHLTGSLVGEQKVFADDYREDEYDSADCEEEPDSDDEEDEDWQPEELAVGSKRKASKAVLGKKKKMKVKEVDDEDDDFIDDSALEEEEEEESDEDDDSETDVLTKLPTPSKKTRAMNTTSEMSPASKKKKKNKQLKTGMEQEKKEANSAGDASSGDSTPTKKKKKKRRRKNKEEHGKQPEQSTNGSQEPQSPTPKPAPAVGKKRSVAGGTSVEDVKIGHGPEAKPGKMVSVYYSGILAKSNKRFDSCLNGKPFRFRLGRGEVIKGWDTGLIGMKVGGKRKIVVPPSQGYGNARQGPIPPGSILVFDVEMKAVN